MLIPHAQKLPTSHSAFPFITAYSPFTTLHLQRPQCPARALGPWSSSLLSTSHFPFSIVKCSLSTNHYSFSNLQSSFSNLNSTLSPPCFPPAASTLLSTPSNVHSMIFYGIHLFTSKSVLFDPKPALTVLHTVVSTRPSSPSALHDGSPLDPRHSPPQLRVSTQLSLPVHISNKFHSPQIRRPANCLKASKRN